MMKDGVSDIMNNGMSDELIHPDPWQTLKTLTPARIALGRVGSSLPTQEVLDFGVCHALARDAVHLPLDVAALDAAIKAEGFETGQVRSQAPDRYQYLLRPDWGRRLHPDSRAQLIARAGAPVDFLLVVGDGLSALAVQTQVPPLLAEIHKRLPAHWQLGEVVIASQARVAIGDEIGELLKARLVAVLIGERPGLSSPDSLGIYLTFNPKVGCLDANRNCISNVRPAGLSYAKAAHTLMWLAQQALSLQLTGVGLKDESDFAWTGLDNCQSTPPQVGGDN